MPFRTSRPLGVSAAKRELASVVPVTFVDDLCMLVFIDPLIISTVSLGKKSQFDSFQERFGIDGL